MCRTVCERREIRGAMRGGVAVTVALTERDPLIRLRDLAEKNPLSIELAHSEIWLAAEAENTKPSTEEALRGRDDEISGCLTMEFLRHEPALRAVDDIRRALSGAEIGVYRLMCCLGKSDLV
jgi:hypothetical protein